MSKKDLAKSLIDANPGLLACPICGGLFPGTDAYSLSCDNRHTFDISSSGYVNLLPGPVRCGYGKAMLEARLSVFKSGFFNPMLRETAGLIEAGMPACAREGLRVLDAGCGEGSQLAWLLECLNGRAGRRAAGIGVDISKDGIRIAAREHPGSLWLVGDLARLPLAVSSLDVIVNILSPSNYSEFKRVLEPGGLLVKAVPGSGYLRELRQAFFDDDRRHYDSGRVQRLFAKQFVLSQSINVRYTVNAGAGMLGDLIRMTPMSWRVGQERIDKLLAAGETEVTADFVVLVGMAV